MLALIFADREGNELAPLNATYPVAMLPVDGKPILEHTLEILREHKVSKIIMVLGADGANIKRYFADGHRWSLEITYLSSRRDDLPQDIIRRLGNTISHPFLALRGDIWNGSINEHDELYCYRVEDETQKINTLSWKRFKHSQSVLNHKLLNTLKDYHSLVISQEIQRASQCAKHPLPDTLRLGIQAQGQLTNIENGSLSLGHYSRIANSVRCSDTVVIGTRCIIDDAVTIRDSVIMDGTYIGPGMDVKHAIVLGNTLIRVDLDIVCKVEEPFLLGKSELATSGLASGYERLLALLCLIMFTPVMLFLSLWAFLSGKKPIYLHQDDDNHLSGLPELTLAGRCKGVLPGLLSIIKGDMHLFGRPAEPRVESDSAVITTWKEPYLKLPVGWLSPAQLLLGNHADPIECELTEIELYQHGKQYYLLHSTYLLLKRLITSLTKSSPFRT